MARTLVEYVPRIDVRECFRIARGTRAGPRTAREGRSRSDGGWDYFGIPLRGTRCTLGASLFVDGEIGTLGVYRMDTQKTVATIELVSEPMRFGGVRWWASCPACGRRCGAVYVRGDRFGCRVCFGLAYASSRQRDEDRALTQQVRLADLLLGNDGLWDGAWTPPPNRPPAGMRRRTFERLARRYIRAQARTLANAPPGYGL